MPKKRQDATKLPEGPELIDPKRANQRWACILLGTTRPTILDWEAKGMPRNADTTYDLAACRQWIDKRREEERQPRASQLTIAEHDQMASEFKAKETRRAYLERAGKLIDRSLAEREHLRIALTTRAALMALPDQLAAKVENLPARDVSRILRSSMHAVCSQFRDGWVPIPDALAAKVDDLVAAHLPLPAEVWSA